MKIITWNVNSVRLRLELLKKLNDIYAPDVICLQETKVEDKDFPIVEINNIGFKYVEFKGQKSYNGVAILSKTPTEKVFSIELYNQDARHISATINNIEIHNFYVPAGGDEPNIISNPKYNHKLEYIKLMNQWFQSNRNLADKIILLGDLNIAPNEHDVWSSKQLRNVISHTQAERELLFNLQKNLQFIDSARYFIDINEKSYSWWSYRNRDWKKSNRGRRLDHIWITTELKPYLQNYMTVQEARDWGRPSDHIPCILNLS